jgi:hypothetical protein
MKKIIVICMAMLFAVAIGSFTTSTERTVKPPGIEIVQQDMSLSIDMGSNYVFNIAPATASIATAELINERWVAESPRKTLSALKEGVLFQLKYLIKADHGTNVNYSATLRPTTTRYICLGYSIWS